MTHDVAKISPHSKVQDDRSESRKTEKIMVQDTQNVAMQSNRQSKKKLKVEDTSSFVPLMETV